MFISERNNSSILVDIHLMKFGYIRSLMKSKFGTSSILEEFLYKVIYDLIEILFYISLKKSEIRVAKCDGNA